MMTDAQSLRPTAIDLFCGAGGLSLGLEQAGFDVVAALEFEPVHARVHEYNFPLCTTLTEDAQTIDADVLRRAIRKGKAAHGRPDSEDAEITLVAGGPPCQGFSTGGHSRPDDDRNGLFFDFVHIVAELHPQYFLIENVPGLLHRHNMSMLQDALGILEAEGYVIDGPHLINAADVGVPQNRVRMVIVGRVSSAPAIDMSMIGKGARRRTVAQAIKDLEDKTFVVVKKRAAHRSSRPAIKPVKKLGRKRVSTRVGLERPRIWDGVLRGLEVPDHAPRAVARFKATRPGHMEPISRYRRLERDGVSNTLRSGTGPDRGSFTPPRPIHYKADRVITAREAARLQSFPDWFGFHTTKWHAWRQIGNAVPPMLGRAIGGLIVNELGSGGTTLAPAIPLGDLGSLKSLHQVSISE